jgi:hypothetical protein
MLICVSQGYIIQQQGAGINPGSAKTLKIRSGISIKHRAPQRVPWFRSRELNGEQQRISLTVHTAFSNGVDTHIAAGLCFQPTRFASAALSQHAPAPYFSFTALHVYNSCLNRAAIIDPYLTQTSAFICRFYLPDKS